MSEVVNGTHLCKSPMDSVEVNNIILGVRTYAQRIGLSEEYLADAIVDGGIDNWLGGMFVEFRRRIPCADGDEIEVPKTWWDHFKVEKFPKWLKKKFPPTMKVYKAHALVPQYENLHRSSIICIPQLRELPCWEIENEKD